MWWYIIKWCCVNVMVLYHLKFSYEFKVHVMQLNGGMVTNFEYF